MAQQVPGIETHSERYGGESCIASTRVRIRSIGETVEEDIYTPRSRRSELLALSDVHRALAYHSDHPDETEQYADHQPDRERRALDSEAEAMLLSTATRPSVRPDGRGGRPIDGPAVFSPGRPIRRTIMSGVELRDGTLVVEREPNRLDELATEFSRLLDGFGIEHAFVAGYVAILAGRARATDDIDVLIEATDTETVDDLAEALDRKGFWGPAIPLASAYEMFSTGDNIWVAPNDRMTPHLEVKFVRDEFDRASPENALTARIDGTSLPIGPLELQIAYKLHLGAQKDVEDAVHLYTIFGETLSAQHLEEWTTRLDVEDEYERLKRA